MSRAFFISFFATFRLSGGGITLCISLVWIGSVECFFSISLFVTLNALFLPLFRLFDLSSTLLRFRQLFSNILFFP